MYGDASRIADEFAVTMERARRETDGAGLFGVGLVVVTNKFGRVTDLERVINKITTAGDQYYAVRGAAAVSPATPADATKVTGMKLGTGVTAASKSGAGAVIGTYITGSNRAFDATFPSTAAVGGDTGWNITYKTTWPAGTVTNSAITEAAISNAAGTDSIAEGAAGMISRITFTAKNKTVDDSLAITWAHTFFG